MGWGDTRELWGSSFLVTDHHTQRARQQHVWEESIDWCCCTIATSLVDIGAIFAIATLRDTQYLILYSIISLVRCEMWEVRRIVANRIWIWQRIGNVDQVDSKVGKWTSLCGGIRMWMCVLPIKWNSYSKIWLCNSRQLDLTQTPSSKINSGL